MNLTRNTGRTTTGVLFLQCYGKGFRYRLSLSALSNAGLHVLPDHVKVFEDIPCGILQSPVYFDRKEGERALIDVLRLLTGIQCEIQ